MFRIALVLSVALAAPSFAEGVWLKGRGEQVWVEQISDDAPERDDRHGFTRVARTRRPVVYVDAEPVGWHRSDHSPTVVVRYGGHWNHHRRHYRSYSYPRYRHHYRSYSYPRTDRHYGHRYDRGHSYRGSHRNRHYRGTRHGRIRHHRGGAFGKARGFSGRQHRGSRRH